MVLDDTIDFVHALQDPGNRQDVIFLIENNEATKELIILEC